MENIHDFIVAIFNSELPEDKRNRGISYVNSNDNEWKELCSANSPARTMFYNKYIDNNNFNYQGHIGTLNRPYVEVYYFAILNNRPKQEIMSGIYVVYLLSADHKNLYFCLAHGVSSFNHDMNAIKQRTDILKNYVTTDRFSKELQPGDYLGEKPISKDYLQSMVCFKKYSNDNIPENSELEDDFHEMMNIYQQCLERYYSPETNEEATKGTENDIPEQATEETQEVTVEDTQSVKDKLSDIKKYIESKGFYYDEDLIENFYLCLKTKPFVLLAGTSGTGKTRLVRLFAKAIGAFDDKRYLQVAVKPDWSDSTDLFGHVNLENEFVPGVIIDFIKKASDDKRNLPYLLCLDEMNLARVEYYFSDFLSVIETRDWNDESKKSIKTDRLVPKSCYAGDETAKAKYENLFIPENLYIIGTVNMDETTFPFSKKVLDRANTIEFSYVNFSLPDSVTHEKFKPMKVNNNFLRAEFLNLQNDCSEQWELVINENEKIEKINELLKKYDAHFGYRTRDEIIFYMLYRYRENLLSEDNAFDNQIMQKILPRIQGSSEAVSDILKDLFEICAGKYDNESGATASQKMGNYIKNQNIIKYDKSANKIWRMLRRFEEDDFTSYWV